MAQQLQVQLNTLTQQTSIWTINLSLTPVPIWLSASARGLERCSIPCRRSTVSTKSTTIWRPPGAGFKLVVSSSWPQAIKRSRINLGRYRPWRDQRPDATAPLAPPCRARSSSAFSSISARSRTISLQPYQKA